MSKTKMIWGAVNRSGTIQAGSGFRARLVPGRTGYMDIIFLLPFAGMPVVTVTQNFPGWNDWDYYNGDARDNAVLVAVNASQCRVLTGDSSGRASARNFTFTAIGPAFT